MSDEIKNLVFEIEHEENFVKLANRLREYFAKPETLPIDYKALIADVLIARAFDLGVIKGKQTAAAVVLRNLASVIDGTVVL